MASRRERVLYIVHPGQGNPRGLLDATFLSRLAYAIPQLEAQTARLLYVTGRRSMNSYLLSPLRRYAHEGIRVEMIGDIVRSLGVAIVAPARA